MSKLIYLYFKNQSVYFASLFLLLVVPLALFFQFSTYPLPKIQYVVLGYLFVFQYALFNEKKFCRKIEPKVIWQLRKELKRTPSKKEIHKRESFVVSCRFVTIVTNAIAIGAVMIYYKQF